MKRLMHRAATSLLTRILLVEGITILVACLAMPFTARTILENSARAIERNSLHQQATLVAGHAIRHADSHWDIALPHEQVATYATGYDGRAFALLADDGRVLARSPYAQPATWPGGLTSAREHAFAAGSQVGLSEPFVIGGQSVHVVVTQDQTRPGAVVDDVVRSFLAHYLGWLVGLLLLMPLANVAMLWPLLRRMRQSAQEASRLTPHEPGARLDPTGLSAEAKAMVNAINGLLGRVEEALALQQEFAGNVAHELRTPLATLRLEAERMIPGPARDIALAQIERMAHVLGQLRDLASLEHDAMAAFAVFDLAELTVDLLAELTPAVLDGGRSLALIGGEAPIPIRGNRALLAMAITNLVDNARIHTPPGTAIEVHLDPAGRIDVIDNGPGVTGQDAGRLARRFWRADQQRSDGAGLGLSIVQRIAQVHGGHLHISENSGGGARFTLAMERCVVL